jgi:NADH dehydrogenase
MLGVIRRQRLVINLPFLVGSIMGAVLDIGSAMTLRLFPNKILTRDQVASLRSDNVVSAGAKTLTDLGITATPMAAVIEEYLWPYRPSGQYTAIKESAKNLRRA